MKRLLLIGGGHAHLLVLKKLATHRPKNVEICLITPKSQQIYSGMLPGWMAGHYQLSDICIDLRRLAKEAGVLLIEGSICALDANRQCVFLSDHTILEYDFLSLNTGSETDLSWLKEAEPRLLAIKPINEFITAWPRLITEATKKSDYRLAVVGGGAAAVELALAAQYLFQQKGLTAQVFLVCSIDGLLKSHAPTVQSKIKHNFTRLGVSFIPYRAVGVAQGLLLASGEVLQVDTVIAATGARPPYWLKLSQLELDNSGYVSVDVFHRSLSHHNVFAAGDVCSRHDSTIAKSGVHAVHAGAILADNLLSVLMGGYYRAYRPKRTSLYLLSCGARRAVASWGTVNVEGAWVWYCKNWIDKRFMGKFSH